MLCVNCLRAIGIAYNELCFECYRKIGRLSVRRGQPFKYKETPSPSAGIKIVTGRP